MNLNYGFLYIILLVVGILLGLAFIWFIIELIMTLKKTRTKIDEIHNQITPTLENVEVITEKIQPVIEKADPLVERISLTVDAANLELMRADQILENVNIITEGVADATTAVGNIANMPSDLLNKASDKIQGIFTGDTVSSIGAGLAGGLPGNEYTDDISRIANGVRENGRVVARKVKKPTTWQEKKAARQAKKAARKAARQSANQANPYLSID